MKYFTLVMAIASLIISCGNDDNTGDDSNNETIDPNIDGMNYVLSDRSFADTYDMLVSALEDNPDITIIAEVNHQVNAESIDQALRPTRVIFFGNPALGTPLMQANQQAGLDLPQRILVYQDENDHVFIGYNNTAYIGTRHSVGRVETLPMIAMALENFSTTAGDSTINTQTTAVTPSQNVVTILSVNHLVKPIILLLQRSMKTQI